MGRHGTPGPGSQHPCGSCHKVGVGDINVLRMAVPSHMFYILFTGYIPGHFLYRIQFNVENTVPV